MKVVGGIFYVVSAFVAWAGALNIQSEMAGVPLLHLLFQAQDEQPVLPPGAGQPPKEIQLDNYEQLPTSETSSQSNSLSQVQDEGLVLPPGAGQPPEEISNNYEQLLAEEIYKDNIKKGRNLDFQIEGSIPFATGFPEKKYPILKHGIDINTSLTCNKFDFDIAFVSTFKNMAKEAMGYIKDTIKDINLTGFLYLLCKAQPTLCQVIQHYRSLAMIKLEGQRRSCEHLEKLAQDMAMIADSQMQYDCVRNKLKENSQIPLTDAIDACKQPIREQFGKQVDLVEEFLKSIGADLNDPNARFAKELLGDLKLTIGGKAEVGKAPDIIPKSIETFAYEYYNTFHRLYKHIKEKRQLDIKDLARISPASFAITEGFLQDMVSYLSPEDIDFYFRNWSRILAMRDMLRTLDNISSKISTIADIKSPITPAEAMKRNIESIRNSIQNLKEISELDKLFVSSLMDARDRVKQVKDMLVEGVISEEEIKNIQNRHKENLPGFDKSIQEILEYLQKDIRQ